MIKCNIIFILIVHFVLIYYGQMRGKKKTKTKLCPELLCYFVIIKEVIVGMIQSAKFQALDKIGYSLLIKI